MLSVIGKYIKNFLQGYFNILLTSLFLLFVFRPYDRGYIYNGFWQLCFLVVLLAAIFNCHHSKPVKIIACSLGVPALLGHWLSLIIPETYIISICLSFTILFIAFCTGAILMRVVFRARVTLETLRGVICAYFLIGFVFALSYFLVEIHLPASFYIIYQGDQHYTYTHYLSEMIYFSFVTFLSIGYGDINAVTDVAQTLAIIEGIIGAFYIAILVARLVAVYSFLENKDIQQKLKKEKTPP